MSEEQNPEAPAPKGKGLARQALEVSGRAAKHYFGKTLEFTKKADQKLHTAEWGAYAHKGYEAVREQVRARVDSKDAGSSAQLETVDTAALERYARGVDWHAVSNAVANQSVDIANRVRDLVKGVDWQRITPVAKKVAIGLAVAVAAGSASDLISKAAPALGSAISGGDLGAAGSSLASFIDMNLNNTMSSATAQSFMNIIGTSWA